MAKSLLSLLAALGLLIGTLLTAAPIASARTTYPLDPAHDVAIPARAYVPACTNRPTGTRCENIFIRGLNRGRAVLNAPAYALPERFHSLTGADQLLVLANLDRKLYGRASIIGRNPTLNTSARRGAASGSDPAFVSVGGQTLTHGGSNWAGGTPSPLFAYFLWMYHDTGAGWMHRHNVLLQSGDDVLIMGVGSGTDAYGSAAWTTLLESFQPGTLIECVPTVLLLSVRSGTDPGSASIGVLGYGFLHVRQVTFGGVPASFKRVSALLLRVVPPKHAPGTVRVQVTTTGGTSRKTAATVYTY